MKLKPCPFCASNNLSIISNGNVKSGQWYVCCNECHVQGPEVLMDENTVKVFLAAREYAIKKWNIRPLEDKNETRN